MHASDGASDRASGCTCDLSVVLPAYEEARNLEVFLPRLAATLDELAGAWEILVVDTMQDRDDTAAVCAATPGVRHIRRRGGDYYGDAIRTGITDSTGARVVIMDTDGSHDPEFVRTLWAARDSADVIIASRYVAGGATENPAILVALSKLLNLVFSVVVRLPARDVSNSFRLYRGAPLRTLKLTSTHFDIQEEILARLLWELPVPATIAEVPFRFKERQFGESKRSMAVFAVAFLGAIWHLRALRRSLRRSHEVR